MEKSAGKKGILLWDIDGTLTKIRSTNSDKHLLAVNTILGTRLSGLSNSEGKTDLQIIKEICNQSSRNLNKKEQISIVEMLDKLTLQETEELPLELNPNIIKTLHSVKELGFINGLLTGNTPNRAKYKLKSCGIEELFSSKYSFYGDKGVDRFELVQDCLSTLKKTNYKKILIIGDTPLDILAASKFRIPIVAVATGNHTFDNLIKFNSGLVLKNLNSDFTNFLSYLSDFLNSNSNKFIES